MRYLEHDHPDTSDIDDGWKYFEELTDEIISGLPPLPPTLDFDGVSGVVG